MKTIEISQIALLLEQYSKTEQPVILTRDGQPIAALFPVEADIDMETFSLSTNPTFTDIIEQSRQSQREAGRVFLDEIHLPADI